MNGHPDRYLRRLVHREKYSRAFRASSLYTAADDQLFGNACAASVCRDATAIWTDYFDVTADQLQAGTAQLAAAEAPAIVQPPSQ